MVTVDAACKAMVSEKKSIDKPSKKPMNIKTNLFSFIGYQ
jgi:hypothetical protein